MTVPVLERRRKQDARRKKNNIHKISTVVVIMMIVMTMILLNQQSSSTSSFIEAFQLYHPMLAKSTPAASTTTTTTTTLWMGKLRNKQAELQRKMEAAKKARMQEEKGQDEDSSSSSSSSFSEATSTKPRISDKEMKELNDRKRFEQLLSSSIAMSPNNGEEGGYDDEDDDETDYSSRGGGVGGDVDMSLMYLSVNQEEENIDAYTRGVERFFEGDTAPEDVFEELVSIKSENAIGETGKKRLLPWLRGKDDDYLVVICDPRQKSTEFQDTVKSLSRFLPKDLLKKAVFVNADTPAENRRFLKKNNLMTDDGGKITLYSDEKMEW
eukprot:CAMPEP_0113467002 /NCGR_PEP_ID=MMETSP0014_2-20120614/14580_1 /TAXON_ID=2857 /ORGANISM="Nitzschia sp." /LENGTH=324 /DNA_ID=CAMNT_0000359277 /DNA_START=101 /DNA_END=1072 /DNA_ORIENTATION=- /assembly_acc=CAM_ASM_000159